MLAENQHDNLSAEQVKFAESIYSAGNDLLNLINDILDISKVEAGKLEVIPENTSVARLADGLRSVFEPLAADKQLTFSVDLQPGAPAMLFTDRQRLEQVIKNLLSNAVKFTEKGTVSLTISAQPNEQIAFIVRDSGIGIATDQQESIFEAFRQADGTTNRKYGGTGLGLSISRDLAALLGGSISVSSTPGQGSVFTLVLPQQYSEQGDALRTPLTFTPPPVSAPAPVAPPSIAVSPTVPVHIRALPMTVARPRSPPAASWWWKTNRISLTSFMTWPMSWVTSVWSPMARMKVMTWPASSCRTRYCSTCACRIIPG